MYRPDDTETRLSDAELALHLAGGTLTSWRRALDESGSGQAGFRAASDAWRVASLAASIQARPPARRPGAGRESPWDGVQERLAALRTPGALQAARDRLDALEARLVGWRGPGYPEALLQLPQPPLALSVIGRWPPPVDVLAVVGARAATTYGVRVAERTGRAAAAAGLAVVSGLARGIDRAALEGCERGHGWGLAVLGCGLDIAYPRQNRALQERLGRDGTLVSEFAPGQRPDRWTFPRRNRVIAALARAVLVVEAGQRSGALITVEHALEIGREILAVPGPIDAPQSVGCNRLLADGATPLLAPTGIGPALGRPAASQPDDGLRDPLLAALGEASCDVDELARRAGWPTARARSRLIALELSGLVRRTASGHWERRP